MKTNYILLFILLLSSGCGLFEPEILDGPRVILKETFRINSEHSLGTIEGFVHNDEYWVWSNHDGTYFIDIYDINSQEKTGEIKYDAWGYGKVMNFVDDLLYIDDVQRGLILINTKTHEFIKTIRYDEANGFSSETPATYFDGYIYKALESSEYAVVLRYDIETGADQLIYRWPNGSLYDRVRISTPIVQETNGIIDMYMPIRLINENSIPPVDQNFFVKAHIDYSNSWIDTLASRTNFQFNYYNSVFHEDNIIFVHDHLLYSIKQSDGSINWTLDKEANSFSKLIAKDDHFYLLISENKLLKFNPINGNSIWFAEFISPIRYDFELIDDLIVYSALDIGAIVVRNNETGDLILPKDSDLNKGHNPKFHAPSAQFITHKGREIIGFTLRLDNG